MDVASLVFTISKSLTPSRQRPVRLVDTAASPLIRGIDGDSDQAPRGKGLIFAKLLYLRVFPAERAFARQTLFLLLKAHKA
ncbi:hypothetical protein G6N82_05965 [Altererythrobacter sp. BO-6]|uniref:hypothetical protein n=1 Tax=Altererythrobacter sp. BO-6 TaxID=2604537 RepID=UPI0013E17AEE|nr:hypothetical protein [Altererythrobacter sp. BO-6]QIG53759.1 hypothetical protein G6N82_05965 [Altererythrobacter sp. BO-6]